MYLKKEIGDYRVESGFNHISKFLNGVIQIEKESEGSEPKKMRLSMKTTKQQQSSLLNYFSMGTTNSVKESLSNSNLSCDTSKSKGNERNYP